MITKNEHGIVQIWDDEKILEENIKFLKTPTKKVTFPIGLGIQKIIDDLITQI